MTLMSGGRPSSGRWTSAGPGPSRARQYGQAPAAGSTASPQRQQATGPGPEDLLLDLAVDQALGEDEERPVDHQRQDADGDQGPAGLLEVLAPGRLRQAAQAAQVRRLVRVAAHRLTPDPRRGAGSDCRSAGPTAKSPSG